MTPTAATSWGDWGSWRYCYGGNYATAMRVKIQETSSCDNTGGGGFAGTCDDTAMNAIRLTCSDGTELISKEGPWGTWSNKVISADGIFGVTLRTEQDQGKAM